MLKYNEEYLNTFKAFLIKTYNDNAISDYDIEIKEEIIDHKIDFNVYKDLHTYEEKIRYIILYDIKKSIEMNFKQNYFMFQ